MCTRVCGVADKIYATVPSYEFAADDLRCLQEGHGKGDRAGSGTSMLLPFVFSCQPCALPWLWWWLCLEKWTESSWPARKGN